VENSVSDLVFGRDKVELFSSRMSMSRCNMLINRSLPAICIQGGTNDQSYM
jgi:hypothetical protein